MWLSIMSFLSALIGGLCHGCEWSELYCWLLERTLDSTWAQLVFMFTTSVEGELLDQKD